MALIHICAVYHTSSDCNRRVDTALYRCLTCDEDMGEIGYYEVHPACVIMPTKLPVSWESPLHDHTLKKMRSQTENFYTCDICYEVISAWVYHCDMQDCTFDAHAKCIMQTDDFGMDFLLPGHKHIADIFLDPDAVDIDYDEVEDDEDEEEGGEDREDIDLQRYAFDRGEDEDIGDFESEVSDEN